MFIDSLTLQHPLDPGGFSQLAHISSELKHPGQAPISDNIPIVNMFPNPPRILVHNECLGMNSGWHMESS